LSMSPFFCIAHVFLFIMITLERAVMEQHGVLSRGWMDKVLAIILV
jgi:hypothetical protein